MGDASTLTPERIAEKRRIAEAATKGPWRTSRTFTWVGNGYAAPWVCQVEAINREANANYIADNDPPSVLAMLDAIERLTAERDEAKAGVDQAWRQNERLQEHIIALEKERDEARAELKGAEEEIECHATEEDGWEHDLLQVSAQRDTALSEAKALREALEQATSALEDWSAYELRMTDPETHRNHPCVVQGAFALVNADAALSPASDDKGGEG